MTAKQVNLTKIVDPKFLTLTGAPANQTAFKIIRKDGENMNMQHVQRKRIRRSDSLVSITFEEGLDEAGVKVVLAEWGIEEFTIETSGDRLKAVLRSDGADATMNVQTPDGRTLTVLKPISNAASDEKKGIAVTRMDFAKDAFPELADITDWLKRNDIDETTVKIVPGDTVTSVQRLDSTDTDTRSLVIEQGVTFNIVRADSIDIPPTFITVVNDTAFGNWGWGQLDFAATMADKEFSNAMEDSIYTLRCVLDRIMFYSDVPVPIRKDLVRSALTQFGDHAISLMDALPSKVVVAIRSSSPKEKEVTKAAPGTPAARQDDATKSGTGQPGAAATTDDTTKDAPAAGDAAATTETLTRADVQAMIAEGNKELSGQIAELTKTLAQRSDTKPAEGEGGEKKTDGEAKPDAEPTLADVMRSVKTLADEVGGLKNSVTTLEGGTVVRSDGGDKTTPQTKDVFRGMFGRREA